MIADPNHYEIGMRYYYVERGLTPQNCPGDGLTESDFDCNAIGHRCGARSTT
jgi:hypothetical protein